MRSHGEAKSHRRGSGSHSRKSKKRGRLEKNSESVRHKKSKSSTTQSSCSSDDMSQSSVSDIQTKKRKKNKALSFEDGSFFPGTTEVPTSLQNKTNAGNSLLVETAEKKASGISSKNADDVAQKSGIARDRSRHQKKYKSTNEKRSLVTFSANSPRISEMVPSQKDNGDTSSLSKQPSSVQRHNDVVADSETENFPQIDSTLKDEKRRQHKRKRGSERKSENSRCGENTKENEDPNAKSSNTTSNEAKRKVTNIYCGVNVEATSDSAKTCLDKSSNTEQCSPNGKTISSPDETKNKDEVEKSAVYCTSETLSYGSTKKLIVLDLNGLLTDVKRYTEDDAKLYNKHTKIGGNLVLKRPFCDDFLKFCFERFHVGVWTSRKRHNAKLVIEHLMGDLNHKLLFCWDESKCTKTGENTVENKNKPLVLKELDKLWNIEHDLQGEKLVFSQSNTLLIDDSPYKSICNPPHTAIFPLPYKYKDESDNVLGPDGALRLYLKRLAMADDVQGYVRDHSFGQRAISTKNSSWKFYEKIINRIKNSSSTAA